MAPEIAEFSLRYLHLVLFRHKTPQLVLGDHRACFLSKPSLEFFQLFTIHNVTTAFPI